jgi:hypothetical protein
MSVLLVLGLLISAGTSDPLDEARAVATAYLANWDELDRFTCRYEQTATAALSEADAFARRYSEPSTVGRFVWAVDGRRYVIRADLPDLEPSPRATTPVKYIGTLKGFPNVKMGEPRSIDYDSLLSNGTVTLNYDRDQPYVHVVGGARPTQWYRALFGPYGCDVDRRCWDFGAGLRTDLDTPDKLTARVDRVTVAGRPLVVVEITNAGNGMRHRLVFDPDRGYVMTEATARRVADDTPVLKLHLLDWRPTGTGRWYPGRVVRMFPLLNNAGWDVRDTRVTEFTVGPPAAGVMSVTVPANCPLFCPDPPECYTRTKQVETVGVDDLGRFYEMLQRHPASALSWRNRPMDTDVRLPDVTFDRPRRWPWVAGAVAAVLAVAAVVRWRVGR